MSNRAMVGLVLKVLSLSLLLSLGIKVGGPHLGQPLPDQLDAIALSCVLMPSLILAVAMAYRIYTAPLIARK